LKLNLAYFLTFIAAGLFFILVDQALLAGLCFLAALLVLATKLFTGTAHVTKTTAGALTKGMKEEVSKAETTHPDSTVLEEGVQGAANLAGQQLYAPDTHQFKLKGFSAIGAACQKIVDLFKKTFK